MNYPEALRSGKRYRRKGWGDEAWEDVELDPHACAQPMMLKHILSDDWETESEQITVTREQVEKAWDASGMHNYRCCGAEFLKALGFK